MICKYGERSLEASGVPVVGKSSGFRAFWEEQAILNVGKVPRMLRRCRSERTPACATSLADSTAAARPYLWVSDG